jgi:putative endonuclease
MPGLPRDRRKALGQAGEEVAAVYLERQGHEIITRNWRTRSGELDIVTREDDWLVFVEVRTRRSSGTAAGPILGTPEESVTPRKQLQLIALADAYLFEMRWEGPWRIDVIALELRSDGSVTRLNHLRDAVGGVV